jgi:hypothetical protein
VIRARPVGALWISIALLLFSTTTLRAQSLGWSGNVEGRASLFFGNTSQWLVAGRSQLVHKDSTLEIRGEMQADYAESVADSGRSVVSARSWLGSLGVDFRPYARVSPFAMGSVQASLQQRLARRYSGGLGGKVVIVDGNDNELSTSAALLWERTVPLSASATSTQPGDLMRWSVRLRVKRRLNDRLLFTHVTFYQPSVQETSRFTVNSTTSLVLDLTKKLALTGTLTDTYDSEARSRGARGNNDGQMLLGMRAKF